MKSILLLLTFSILVNIQTYAQRDRQGSGRGQESGRIERIKRNQVDNRQQNTNRRNIQHNQSITQKPKQIQPTNIIYFEQHEQSICIVKNPDMYNFPDRIYDIPYIEPVLQHFFMGDFDGAIELLNYLIQENQMGPELYFLRGIAYIKRQSEFKLDDYYKAKSDFILLNGWDPYFPQLSHYLDLVELCISGKRPNFISTR